MKTYKPTVQ